MRIVLKIVSFCKTNTPKQIVYGKGKKLSKTKTQNKIRSLSCYKKKKKIVKTFRDIWTLFETEKEKNKTKKIEKKRN